MLDHVSPGVSDIERSRRFYDRALGPLGIVRTVDFDAQRAWSRTVIAAAAFATAIARAAPKVVDRNLI